MSLSALMVGTLLAHMPLDSASLPLVASTPVEIAASAVPFTPGAPSPLPAPAEAAAADAPATDEITVSAHLHHAPGDPLESTNIKAFAMAQAMDDGLVAPASRAYEHGVPKPVRSGLRNFFHNLHEPIAFVNHVLQFKFGRAAKSFGRFAVNTTIGVGGVIDMAKRRPFNLPYRYNGFANTLAYYGVKPGPFLFLPLIGPTTLRDLVGRGLDVGVMPMPGGVAYAASSTVVKSLDRRVEMDGQIREQQNSGHAYASAREAYLHQREIEVAALHSHRKPADNALAELSPPALAPVVEP